MLMMTSQILKSVDFTKTQKSWYLENEALFFLHIKKFINYILRATLWQNNSFSVEVTLEVSYIQKNNSQKMEVFKNFGSRDFQLWYIPSRRALSRFTHWNKKSTIGARYVVCKFSCSFKYPSSGNYNLLKITTYITNFWSKQ